jgi:hypothetical protein
LEFLLKKERYIKMADGYAFRLTEEIARWAFEVKLSQNNDWHIAFTNPTAGPWKRITALNTNGIDGEVHRFARDEERPDLLLVSDTHQMIIILEAKDSLPKLITDTQIRKSAQVVLTLAEVLKGKRENPFWGKRADYNIVAGLLWGAEVKSTETDRQKAFELYQAHLLNKENLCSEIMVGIESFRDKNGGISCSGCVSHHGELAPDFTGKSLLETLTVLGLE